MRRPELIARQAGHPRGLLGRVVCRIMAFETATQNTAALDLLAPGSADHILEVGFGHGRTLALAARIAHAGFVAGVDVSADMTRVVARRERALVTAGRLEVRCADSSRLPYPAARFDRVLAVHTLYFWREPQEHLREIARVTKPGGRFVLGFRPREDAHAVADLPASVYTFYEASEVAALVGASGFVDVELVREERAPRIVFAVGKRGLTT